MVDLVPGEPVQDPVAGSGRIAWRPRARPSRRPNTPNSVVGGRVAERIPVAAGDQRPGVPSAARTAPAARGGRLGCRGPRPRPHPARTHPPPIRTPRPRPTRTRPRTNQSKPVAKPLVVTVLLAQRTFASELARTTTMQPSDRLARQAGVDDLLRATAGGRRGGARRSREASSCRPSLFDRCSGSLMPRKRADGQPCETARDLARLSLAAVEGAAEQVGLRPADRRPSRPRSRWWSPGRRRPGPVRPARRCVIR